MLKRQWHGQITVRLISTNISPISVGYMKNKIGSGYRTACGSLNLKPYSTTFCNMTVTHDESAVGLVATK